MNSCTHEMWNLCPHFSCPTFSPTANNSSCWKKCETVKSIFGKKPDKSHSTTNYRRSSKGVVLCPCSENSFHILNSGKNLLVFHVHKLHICRSEKTKNHHHHHRNYHSPSVFYRRVFYKRHKSTLRSWSSKSHGTCGRRGRVRGFQVPWCSTGEDDDDDDGRWVYSEEQCAPRTAETFEWDLKNTLPTLFLKMSWNLQSYWNRHSQGNLQSYWTT